MPQITYTLGSTQFDVVPETMIDKEALEISCEATVGRAKVYSIGIADRTIVLQGRYMTLAVRDAIREMLDQCREIGSTVEFDDGFETRNVLIRSFETAPLIGKTEGFSFKIELVVAGG